MSDITVKTISQRRAYVEVMVCVFFWGASFALMKISVNALDALLAVWFRIFFGMFVLLSAALLRREFRLPRGKEWGMLLLLGAQGVVLHQNIQFVGMASAGVANANWLMAATPGIVAVLGWAFLGERLPRSAIGGLCLAVVGVLLVLGLGNKGLGLFRLGGFGDCLIAISAINWALLQILSRRFVSGKPPTFVALWMNLAALALQSVLVALFPPDYSRLPLLSRSEWAALIFLGAVCSGLCYVFWYDGLSVMSAARVTAFQYFQPIFGVIVAYFLSGERFTPFILVGGALILFGVWLVNRKPAKEAKT